MRKIALVTGLIFGLGITLNAQEVKYEHKVKDGERNSELKVEEDGDADIAHDAEYKLEEQVSGDNLKREEKVKEKTPDTKYSGKTEVKIDEDGTIRAKTKEELKNESGADIERKEEIKGSCEDGVTVITKEKVKPIGEKSTTEKLEHRSSCDVQGSTTEIKVE